MAAIDPDAVFTNAMSFVIALRHLNRLADHRTPQLAVAGAIPLLMTGALTIELLLKTFHSLDHGRVPKTHNLADLFRNLPMASRIAISKRWKTGAEAGYRKTLFDAIEKTTGRRPPNELVELLDRASTAFEVYRYSFEEPPEGSFPDFLLSDFPQMLVDVLVTKRPEWNDWTPRMPAAFEKAAKAPTIVPTNLVRTTETR